MIKSQRVLNLISYQIQVERLEGGCLVESLIIVGLNPQLQMFSVLPFICRDGDLLSPTTSQPWCASPLFSLSSADMEIRISE